MKSTDEVTEAQKVNVPYSKSQKIANGLEYEQTPGDSEGQGSLVCCNSWGHKELDTT